MALEKTFSGWPAFKSEFRQFLPDINNKEYIIGKYLFRGQRVGKWDLESSFDRLIGAKPLIDRNSREKFWIRSFFDGAGAYRRWDCDATDPVVAAVAQHYGLPTRLLDWSRSPYVAAFFGLFDHITTHPRTDSDGFIAIWALDSETFKSRVDTSLAEIIHIRDVENQRMKNQEGRFTRLNTNDRFLNEFVWSGKSVDPQILIRFLIPTSAAVEALEDLMLMGIYANRLFPEMEGISKDLKLRVGMRKELGKDV
ncbi:FRG domain-containing protein [Mesorhizobium sp. 43Arga]